MPDVAERTAKLLIEFFADPVIGETSLELSETLLLEDRSPARSLPAGRHPISFAWLVIRSIDQSRYRGRTAHRYAEALR